MYNPHRDQRESALDLTATLLRVGRVTVLERREERRLAAILAADIVGYSRLIETNEKATLTAIRAIRVEIIDPQIAQGITCESMHN
jgi:class 3 adenylate cyclase